MPAPRDPFGQGPTWQEAATPPPGGEPVFKTPLSQWFDVIVHVQNTTPSRPL